jgi:hypothetical protein
MGGLYSVLKQTHAWAERQPGIHHLSLTQSKHFVIIINLEAHEHS